MILGHQKVSMETTWIDYPDAPFTGRLVPQNHRDLGFFLAPIGGRVHERLGRVSLFFQQHSKESVYRVLTTLVIVV